MPQTAYFVHRPRRWSDLCRPHALNKERPYHVTAIVILNSMDYENFSEDLLADRVFLEKYSSLCGEGTILRCILVRTKTGPDGILVCPKGPFVHWAAHTTHALVRSSRVLKD